MKIRANQNDVDNVRTMYFLQRSVEDANKGLLLYFYFRSAIFYPRITIRIKYSLIIVFAETTEFAIESNVAR